MCTKQSKLRGQSTLVLQLRNAWYSGVDGQGKTAIGEQVSQSPVLRLNFRVMSKYERAVAVNRISMLLRRKNGVKYNSLTKETQRIEKGMLTSPFSPITSISLDNSRCMMWMID